MKDNLTKDELKAICAKNSEKIEHLEKELVKMGVSEVDGKSIIRNTHRWTYEEDLLCSTLYVETYVLHKRDLDIYTLAYDLSENLTEIPITSIILKLRNIKQITIEKNIEDSFRIAPREKYSRQCLEAFEYAYKTLVMKG